jgi:hypothetical protein
VTAAKRDAVSELEELIGRDLRREVDPRPVQAAAEGVAVLQPKAQKRTLVVHFARGLSTVPGLTECGAVLELRAPWRSGEPLPEAAFPETCAVCTSELESLRAFVDTECAKRGYATSHHRHHFEWLARFTRWPENTLAPPLRRDAETPKEAPPDETPA